MAVEVPTPTGPARPDLKILETRIYRGPNIWSYQPAIHLVVDLGSLEDYPTVSLPGFTDQLVELVPGLERHTCSLGRRGGFIERLHEGTWLGHVAEHVALQLQTLAGHDSRRGKTRAVKGGPGHYNVVYSYTDETVGVAAGKLAVRLINHLVDPRTASTSRRSSTPSCVRPSGWPSAPRPRPSSRRRPRATSPTSASTPPRWSSSGRACTPSASGPR